MRSRSTFTVCEIPGSKGEETVSCAHHSGRIPDMPGPLVPFTGSVSGLSTRLSGQGGDLLDWRAATPNLRRRTSLAQ
jgi:hypothetical protein